MQIVANIYHKFHCLYKRRKARDCSFQFICLETIHPGILKSLELEKIKLFPKVRKRLGKEGLIANKNVSCAKDQAKASLR
jgi:hypothetical protein